MATAVDTIKANIYIMTYYNFTLITRFFTLMKQIITTIKYSVLSSSHT